MITITVAITTPTGDSPVLRDYLFDAMIQDTPVTVNFSRPSAIAALRMRVVAMAASSAQAAITLEECP